MQGNEIRPNIEKKKKTVIRIMGGGGGGVGEVEKIKRVKNNGEGFGPGDDWGWIRGGGGADVAKDGDPGSGSTAKKNVGPLQRRVG